MVRSQEVSLIDELPAALPLLEAGDCLDQKLFHARYEAMPVPLRAELIEGMVYMPSPLKVQHGRLHNMVSSWLEGYSASTPGTAVLNNATVILGEASEPQPDNSLIVAPEHGGQTRENEAGYLVGSPELIVEVASSSASYDLHAKKRDYEKAGVHEYLVLSLLEKQAHWFIRNEPQGPYTPLASGPDGILRSLFFGGLWLDAGALFQRDTTRLGGVLRQGLSSDEHRRTLERLHRP